MKMCNRTSLPATAETKELVAQCGNTSESYDDVLQKIAKYYLTHAVHQNVVSKEKEQSADNTCSNTNPTEVEGVAK